jgi:hypothetical protein
MAGAAGTAAAYGATGLVNTFMSRFEFILLIVFTVQLVDLRVQYLTF